jgi:hypothetical protein
MKKKKLCARCGKRELFMKNFERINYKEKHFCLCVECSQIVYKAKDFALNNEIENSEKQLSTFKEKIVESNDKQALLEWLDSFSQNLIPNKSCIE